MSNDPSQSLVSPTSPTNDKMAPGKRRPLQPSISSLDHPLRQQKLSTESRSTRKRKLFFYSLAFLIMLALSAVLDIRRKSLRERRPKLQLTLPSGTSLSSINDPQAQSNPVHLQNSNPSLTLRPSGLTPHSSSNTEHQNHPSLALLRPPVAVVAPSSTDSDPPKNDPVLSDQELKDDVDQLIAHVDEQAAADASKSAAALNTSHPSTPNDSIVSTVTLNSSYVVPVEHLDPGSSSSSVNSTENVRLNSEEHFLSAQERIKALLQDEHASKLVDENDVRTLEALALQATRGDCEQKSAAEGGSLFKTDAEAASNVDIERTDPLWGAWCLFMGSYKTDAMRDYVTKHHILEEKLSAAKLIAETNSTNTNDTTSFDPNATSLDDVLTPEQQNDLRYQTDRIMGHLQEYDIRYLAALSLQASFGDCGPYGKEVSSARESDEKRDLRILREPLLEQTVIRRQGAQWGAWCVLQGKKRTTAAAELSQRLDLLVRQLAESEAPPEVVPEEVNDKRNETISSESSDM